MGRAPLPLGTWGRIRFLSGPNTRRGKPTYYRARAKYRDFDGVTRVVEAVGGTKSAAEANLLQKLHERSHVRHGASLKSVDRFSVAADLWINRIRVMVAEGRRSAGTLETYQRHLDNHVLPALGEVRLGEISVPLIDQVISAIKRRVSATTAKSCRSVISGVLGVAARHGAIASNPVRDLEPLDVAPKRRPRALDDTERALWFESLAADPRAVKADIPDLTLFMLCTGTRIGEALGVTWEEVNLATGEVAITKQVIRVKGEGLVHAKTKSVAGERLLRVPMICLEMLRARWEGGARLDEPVFCAAQGRLRDPSNVRRALREARSPVGSQARRDLGVALAGARRAAGLTQRAAAAALALPHTRVSLIEAGRVRLNRAQVLVLLDAYEVGREARAKLLTLVDQASAPVEADALAWITSHNFRKTTATILDDAGQSARQIADQLGHARPSMTQDVYMGRRAQNPRAAEALEEAIRGVPDQKGGHKG